MVLVKSILRIFRAIQGIAKCSASPTRPCRLLLKMLHISDQQVVKLFWQRFWTILIIKINNFETNFNFCLLRHFARTKLNHNNNAINNIIPIKTSDRQLNNISLNKIVKINYCNAYSSKEKTLKYMNFVINKLIVTGIVKQQIVRNGHGGTWL